MDINEYIEQFGNRSFTELPFSDADNLVFSQLAYLDLETIVSPSFNAEPQPFSDVCNRLFAAHGYRHSPLGLVLPKDASVNSMRMAIQKRYSEMKVWAAKTAYGRSPALQFAAVTFLFLQATGNGRNTARHAGMAYMTDRKAKGGNTNGH